jgi:hypothetical protein
MIAKSENRNCNTSFISTRPPSRPNQLWQELCASCSRPGQVSVPCAHRVALLLALSSARLVAAHPFNWGAMARPQHLLCCFLPSSALMLPNCFSSVHPLPLCMALQGGALPSTRALAQNGSPAMRASRISDMATQLPKKGAGQCAHTLSRPRPLCVSTVSTGSPDSLRCPQPRVSLPARLPAVARRRLASWSTAAGEPPSRQAAAG